MYRPTSKGHGGLLARLPAPRPGHQPLRGQSHWATAYAAAAGIAVTVAGSNDLPSASARLAPVLYPAFRRHGGSTTSYAIRRVWATEQWLLDAVRWRA